MAAAEFVQVEDDDQVLHIINVAQIWEVCQDGANWQIVLSDKSSIRIPKVEADKLLAALIPSPKGPSKVRTKIRRS